MITKSEIEKDIEGQGNFVKIDHLNRFLKQDLSMDVKRFVFLKLADIYESTGMPRDAAKMYNNAGLVSITFRDKAKYFTKETEMYVAAGDFESADDAMKKALSQVNSAEKENILSGIKDVYRKEAEACEKNLRRGQAIRFYEHLARMRLSDNEREKVKEKLLNLYDKTGNIRKAKLLKGGLD